MALGLCASGAWGSGAWGLWGRWASGREYKLHFFFGSPARGAATERGESPRGLGGETPPDVPQGVRMVRHSLGIVLTVTKSSVPTARLTDTSIHRVSTCAVEWAVKDRGGNPRNSTSLAP